MTTYKTLFSKAFSKDLKKLDKYKQGIIIDWISRNLQSVTNPRSMGKPLKGYLNGLWRYRVGEYRIIAEIKDDELVILTLSVGHRKDVYKPKK